jgi:hypothetical protein
MDYEKVNEIVKNGASEVKGLLTNSIDQNNIKHVSSKTNYEPLKNIKTRVSIKNGIANRIRISFKRSGVFVHKGVGRGGSAHRTAKPWFNPVIEKFTDDLASKVADEMCELTLNNLKIK